MNNVYFPLIYEIIAQGVSVIGRLTGLLSVQYGAWSDLKEMFHHIFDQDNRDLVAYSIAFTEGHHKPSGLSEVYTFGYIYCVDTVVTFHKSKKMNPKDIKEIKIGFSCLNEWSKMAGTENKRLCESCNESVYNFAELTNAEILKFLANRTGQKTCGMFEQSQIKSINRSISDPSNSRLYKPFILATTLSALASCGTTKQVCETEHEHRTSSLVIINELNNPDSVKTTIIAGQVYNGANEPLIGANIIIDKTSIGSTTDFEGKFKLELEKAKIQDKTASVSYVGYETMQVPLVNIKNKEVLITLVNGGVLLGDVVIKRHPFHKRMWNRLKSIFK